MIFPQTPKSAEERKRVARLEVARRLYRALAVQDPDRLITLRDGVVGWWLATIHGLSRVIQRLPRSWTHVSWILDNRTPAVLPGLPKA